MGYSVLVNNFATVRTYMRDFVVYGFRTRMEFDQKSPRKYDNEQRRVRNWLGGNTSAWKDRTGKRIYVSFDNRRVIRNPLYNAYKAKTFTHNDITLHFFLLEVLQEGKWLSFAEIAEAIAALYSAAGDALRLSQAAGRGHRTVLPQEDAPIEPPDDSTLRKKLQKYEKTGLLRTMHEGRKVKYARAVSEVQERAWAEAALFASEMLPLGVVGSFFLDRQEPILDEAGEAGKEEFLTFKHHYFLGALDETILDRILSCREQHGRMKVTLYPTRGQEPSEESRSREYLVYPLRVLLSTQSGRQSLMTYDPARNRIQMFRLDRISSIEGMEQESDAGRMRAEALAGETLELLWGTSLGSRKVYRRSRSEPGIVLLRGASPGSRKGSQNRGEPAADTLMMLIHVDEGEDHILDRLNREKRHGSVERLDEHTLRYKVTVYDAAEMIPWLRTFIGRIEKLECSNPLVIRRFENDLEQMRRMYGV